MGIEIAKAKMQDDPQKVCAHTVMALADHSEFLHETAEGMAPVLASTHCNDPFSGVGSIPLIS